MNLQSASGVIAGSTPTLPAPLGGELALCRDFDFFSICERTYEPNLRIQLHSHQNAFLSFLVAGSCTEIAAGQEYLCRAGMVWYRPVGIPHANVFHERGARILAIELHPSLLERVSASGDLNPTVSVMLSPEVLAITTRLREEFWRAPNQASSLVLDCLVMELLLESHRASLLPAGGTWAAVTRAAEILQSELSTRRSLQEIAQLVGLHPEHLSRSFQRRFQCTISGYMQRCRVEKAKLLLAKTHQSLSDISLRCGFYDQSHFAKTFKKLEGINPLRYRKNLCE